MLPNQRFPTLPAMAGPHYVYQEAGWIRWSFGIGLTACAGALIYLGIFADVDMRGAISLLCLFAAVAMLYAANLACDRDGAPLFVCTPAGIYFPQRKMFKAKVEQWLLVPWQNVIDYRVQLLFDETSSQGLVITLVASVEEERLFFTGRNVYGLPKLPRFNASRVILVGYTTFLPRASEMQRRLREYDGLQRHEDDTTIDFHGSLPEGQA